MAGGTSEISDFTGWSVLLSCAALALLFGSLCAAISAAKHTKRTANAAERSEGAFVDIELSTNPGKFLPDDLKNNQKMTIRVSINNYGRTPARSINYKVTPVLKGNQPIFCEGLIGILPPSKDNTERFLKDFAAVDTTFPATSWLMGKGTDFVVEWNYETIFSKKVHASSYTARFQTDTDGVVDYTINTTYQHYSPWFQRINESESVSTKKNENQSPAIPDKLISEAKLWFKSRVKRS